jgi:hypothetical protein
MNKETTHFKQRFTTTGLRLGLRMNLKNKNQYGNKKHNHSILTLSPNF